METKIKKLLKSDLRDKEKVEFWVKTMNILLADFDYLKGRYRFYVKQFYDPIDIDQYAALYSALLDAKMAKKL